MGRTAKDSFKIGSHRPPNCRPGCNQRKQVIADFKKQFIPSEKSEGIFMQSTFYWTDNVIYCV